MASVALLFPGTGAQQVRMGAGLYQREPAFTEAIDELLDAMGTAGYTLRQDWLDCHPAASIDHVTRSTPLLFAVGYALGRLVQSWGIRPAALLGHSAGEMAAATLAGVFEPAEAARLVTERVRVLATAPAGGMLAVAARAEDLHPYLGGEFGPDLALAAVNAPRQTILSGLSRTIEEVTRRLRADGFVCRRVPSCHPFHSPVMAPLAETEAPRFAAARLRPPRTPMFSGYTGGPLDDATATDPGFWTRHPAMPVLFWPALNALLATGDHVLVEAGPGEGLASLARLHPAVASRRSRVVAMLPVRVGSPDDDLRAVRAAAARLTAAPARMAG